MHSDSRDRAFSAREVGTLLLPGLAALTIRILLGNPTDVDWTDMRMHLWPVSQACG